MASTEQQTRLSGFLMKTYEILESGKHNNAVSWSTDGTGFIVHDTKALAENVLPAYFKHSNFQSFVRQLNMYGFHKIRTPKTEVLYTHPLFCRGQRHLVKEICRKVEKKMQKSSRQAKSSQRSIEANINPQCTRESHAIEERPRNPNQVRCRNYLANLLNINWSLLEEQTFLLEDMKKEWSRMERAVPTCQELLQLYKENTPGTIEYPPGLQENHRQYREQREQAARAVDLYLQVSRQMLSKLCVQSRNLLQHQPDRFAETNTSLSHLH